jgi:predicted nucleic acid-binding protein
VVTTLVDSNVLFDVLTEDEEWCDWSSAMLEKAANAGAVAINQIIYAEISVRYTTIEQLDEELSAEYCVRAPLPWQAAFLAGKAFGLDKTHGNQTLAAA